MTGSGDTASHWFTQYRCFLPDLAGFSGSNCAAPLSLQAVASLKRREWDSNPRWSYPHTRFPSVLLKPLGHLSKGSCTSKPQVFDSTTICLSGNMSFETARDFETRHTYVPASGLSIRQN